MTKRTIMKHLMYVPIMMMVTLTGFAQEAGETCVPKSLEEECQVGRFKHQCTILDCVGRQIIVVKSKDGRPKIIMFKSNCFGEKVIYRRSDIET